MFCINNIRPGALELDRNKSWESFSSSLVSGKQTQITLTIVISNVFFVVCPELRLARMLGHFGNKLAAAWNSISKACHPRAARLQRLSFQLQCLLLHTRRLLRWTYLVPPSSKLNSALRPKSIAAKKLRNRQVFNS